MTVEAAPGCASLDELEACAAGREPPPPHVAACEACRRRLDEVRANLALLARLSEAGLGPEAPPSAGEGPMEIDGYEILEELHRGGQGIVYLARQLATRRTCALKVLLSGAFATSRQRMRFEREVDMVAGLSHPNVVTVYDSGVTADGRHWLAMEHVEGLPLDEYLASRRDAGAPLPRDALLELFAAICAAVASAHARGVIHRDLKPGNILVDGDGAPHVVDFGLAKPADPEIARQAAIVTVEGGFVGTLAYASPEQAGGDPSAIDVRSDVYALGVILYEMLAGRLPYEVIGPLSGVLETIRHAAPRPLRGAGTLYRVDDELETIAFKSLAKDPARRYQSAALLERDVRSYMDGQPIDAKRDSGWYLVTKALRRYRLQAAAIAAFIVLLAASSVALLITSARVREQARKVSAINIFLEDTMGSVSSSTGRDPISLRETLDEGVQWVDLVLGGDPEIEAAVRIILGNGYRNLRLLEDAEAQLTLALAASRKLGAGHLQTAKALSSLALLRRDEGDLDGARALLAESRAIRVARLGTEHLETALVDANLAEVAFRAGDAEQAETAMRQVMQVRERLRGPDHPDVAMCLFNLGRYAAARGDLEAAVTLHADALARRERALPAAHPDVARSLMAVAQLHGRRAEHREAEALLRRCLDLRRGAGRPLTWQVAETEGALGECLVAQGRYGDAEPLLLSAWQHRTDDATPRARLVALYEAWDRPGEVARWAEQ